MMFLFGGIPEIYHARFLSRARREIDNAEFTSLPLYEKNGTYSIDREYCEELVNTLTAYSENHQWCLDEGLGVVLLQRDWEKESCELFFWPFALCESIKLSKPLYRRGEAAKQVANIYAASAISAAKRLRKGIGALTTEFSTRLRRTPLLLPIRRFGSDHLVTLLSSTGEAIKGDHVPSDVIKDACLDFERKHPYAKAGMRQGRFENLAGVEFVAPGRADHHGRRALKVGNGHNEACYLNARLRLGGAFADGFHYDCTRQRRAYSGIFGNCHDAEASYTGRPHLNVYPNDFIR